MNIEYHLIDGHILVLWWQTSKWQPADALVPNFRKLGQIYFFSQCGPAGHWRFCGPPIHVCQGFWTWITFKGYYILYIHYIYTYIYCYIIYMYYTLQGYPWLSLSPTWSWRGSARRSPLQEQWVAAARHSKIPGSEKLRAATLFFWRMGSQVISHQMHMYIYIYYICICVYVYVCTCWILKYCALTLFDVYCIHIRLIESSPLPSSWDGCSKRNGWL